MSEQIAFTKIEGPQGAFEVSTIKTFSGGAPENARPLGSPVRESDYAEDIPWPYETMVFKGGRTGYYHEPHATLKAARDGHVYAVSCIRAGTLAIGAGVRGPFGVPSTTPDEWRDRVSPVPR